MKTYKETTNKEQKEVKTIVMYNRFCKRKRNEEKRISLRNRRSTINMN